MSNKLRCCKACGQQIAKSAKHCPHCGAKNKNGHPFLLFIIVIAVVVIIMTIVSDKSPDAGTNHTPSTTLLIYNTSGTTKPSDTPVDNTSPTNGSGQEDNHSHPTEITEVTDPSIALVDGMRPEFKAAMDSYEAFFEEYCTFMKKYSENPYDPELLIDYADYLSQYADTMNKLEKMGGQDLNDAELKYYVDVQARITKMLIDIAG